MPPTPARDKDCTAQITFTASDSAAAAAVQSEDESAKDKKDVQLAVDREHDAKHSSLEHSFEKSEHVECVRNKWTLFKTILSGQVLSWMLCSTGTAATALSYFYDIKAPCFSAFLMYCLLASTFGIRLALKGEEFRAMLKARWWKYVLIALMDMEANYMLTKAYSYTTLTSVQLCDSFTIPTVMFFSFIFLRIRYKIIHYVGVVICLSGAVCLIFADTSSKGDNASNEILGDVIALCAAFLYGTANVAQEHCVKKFSADEYLGMIGLCGCLFSGIQTIIVEKNVVASINWQWQVGLIFAAFAVCQFFYYSVMPYVMKLSSAAVVNLSLLTSDLYTLLVGLSLFGYKFSYLYFIAFGGILTGLLIYNIKPTPVAPKRLKKCKKDIEALCSNKKPNLEKKDKPWTISIFKGKNGLIDNQKHEGGIQLNGNVKFPLLSSSRTEDTGEFGSFGYTRL